MTSPVRALTVKVRLKTLPFSSRLYLARQETEACPFSSSSPRKKSADINVYSSRPYSLMLLKDLSISEEERMPASWAMPSYSASERAESHASAELLPMALLNILFCRFERFTSVPVEASTK